MNAAAAKLKQTEAMKTDMFLAHLKAFQEIKSMLTPGQKSKLKEMMASGMGMAKGCNCDMMKGKKAHHGKKNVTK
jgi:Spy/CpxP family protein refolding chaperone